MTLKNPPKAHLNLSKDLLTNWGNNKIYKETIEDSESFEQVILFWKACVLKNISVKHQLK